MATFGFQILETDSFVRFPNIVNRLVHSAFKF